MQSARAPSFSQLWVEESEELLRLGGAVPDNGTIVDIGTAQGGSASIFHNAAGGRGAAIYTYDPQPSAEAYANLAGSSAIIRAHTSAEGAREWRGGPVHLLFVDGSHHLTDVVRDYNAWSGHLAPGATVAFHDFDPVERGGLIHLGVKVALEAMLSAGLLWSPHHVGRLLSGTVAAGAITTAGCLDAIRTIGERVAVLCRAGVDFAIPPDRASGPVFVDNLRLCYLLERALIDNRSAVLERTRDRKAFFKWEEVLATLDHGTASTRDITERFAQIDASATLDEASALVAREQVRLVCLTRMFHAITGHEL